MALAGPLRQPVSGATWQQEQKCRDVQILQLYNNCIADTMLVDMSNLGYMPFDSTQGRDARAEIICTRNSPDTRLPAKMVIKGHVQVLDNISNSGRSPGWESCTGEIALDKSVIIAGFFRGDRLFWGWGHVHPMARTR